MTKRITLLLAVIFSWLFVGSLIMFHQEMIQGSHNHALSHLFIVPKSKDKDSYHVKKVPFTQKVNFSTGDITAVIHSGNLPLPGFIEKVDITTAGLYKDCPTGIIHGLRAPPAA